MPSRNPNVLLSSLVNPYAPHLGGQDPYQVIRTTAERLAALVDALGPEGVHIRPAEGKWSTREILCHVADTEIVFAFRLRQALAETHHIIQPFDQDEWARSYAAYDVNAALIAFAAVRDWNLKFIAAASPDTLTKPLTHPERGQMTFRTLIETMAGHDVNHLRQVEALAGKS